MTREDVNISLEQMGENFAIDDFIDRLIFIENVKEGLNDSNNKIVFSEQEAENQLSKWLK